MSRQYNIIPSPMFASSLPMAPLWGAGSVFPGGSITNVNTNGPSGFASASASAGPIAPFYRPPSGDSFNFGIPTGFNTTGLGAYPSISGFPGTSFGFPGVGNIGNAMGLPGLPPSNGFPSSGFPGSPVGIPNNYNALLQSLGLPGLPTFPGYGPGSGTGGLNFPGFPPGYPMGFPGGLPGMPNLPGVPNPLNTSPIEAQFEAILSSLEPHPSHRHVDFENLDDGTLGILKSVLGQDTMQSLSLLLGSNLNNGLGHDCDDATSGLSGLSGMGGFGGVGGGDLSSLLLMSALSGDDDFGTLLSGNDNLLQSLLSLFNGDTNNDSNLVDLINSIIRPNDPVGETDSAHDDPHFRLGGRLFDFHGNPDVTAGGVSSVRIIEGSRVTINATTKAASTKAATADVYPSVFQDVEGEIDGVRFSFNSSEDKLMVNGREIKRGESADAIDLGGGEGAFIARRADGVVEINDGQQTLRIDRKAIWNNPTWAGMNGYINLEVQVNAGGLRELRGGIFNLTHVGLSDQKLNEMLTGRQYDIDKRLYDIFKTNGIGDFSGDRLPAGAVYSGAFAGENSSGGNG